MYKIFAYSVAISITLLNSHEAFASNDVPEDEISVVKVQHVEELEPFSSVGRMNSYKKDLSPDHYDWGPNDTDTPYRV